MIARVALALFLSFGAVARADAPDAATLASELGLSASDLANARAGQIVSREAKPSNPRELTAEVVFLVPQQTPAALVELGRQGLLDRIDPNTTRFGVVDATASPASFAKLALGSGQAQVWSSAAPGSTLNVSTAEIAALDAASNADQAVQTLLAQRVGAYRAQGLAGIAPYARGDGESRSAGDDLRSATQASQALHKYAPNAYAFLLGYPQGKPTGTEEVTRWSQIEAHGVPTIVLTQLVWIPDGDAWVVAQRQFYVSTGYNCEQAVAAFLPVSEGTLVFYVNRTSTDQVTGWGGSVKRDLGSRILESSLKDLFEKARKSAASQ
jgi:hypothetical protein